VIEPLSLATLSSFQDPVVVPRYDRALLKPRIAHIGPGNFHRVHQAVYLDRCLAAGYGDDWGICGIELVDGEEARSKWAAYRKQDCLYTVTEVAADGGSSTRVVGAMIEYLHAPAEPEAALARLADPDTRIISLTITEGGYNIDEITGRFDLTNPAIVEELADGIPRTAFGYVVEAFWRRKRSGAGPVTILSCDNLRGNGDTARRSILGFAEARAADLVGWIEQNVSFPNSMVDRIAPRVTSETRARLNASSGVNDLIPVFSESHLQWVIEDKFVAGRPRWEEVGVELRPDVAAFEAIKGRILNASHVMLAYPAVLCGYREVHQALADDRLRRLLAMFIERDVIPRLDSPPGVSLRDYGDSVLRRFSNPALADQLLRIVNDGASRIPTFHSTTIMGLASDGGCIDREAFLIACFARYLEGTDDLGAAFPVDEPHLHEDDRKRLREGDATVILQTTPFFRLRLWTHEPFMKAFHQYSKNMELDKVSTVVDFVSKL